MFLFFVLLSLTDYYIFTCGIFRLKENLIKYLCLFYKL